MFVERHWFVEQSGRVKTYRCSSHNQTEPLACSIGVRTHPSELHARELPVVPLDQGTVMETLMHYDSRGSEPVVAQPPGREPRNLARQEMLPKVPKHAHYNENESGLAVTQQGIADLPLQVLDPVSS